jgi:biopolymer transport protein ExbB
MPANFHWLNALGTSPVFLILVGCSVVMLGVTIERLVYYAKRRGDPDATLRRALADLGKGDRKEASRTCESSPHPFGAVASALLAEGVASEAAVDERMHIALSEQKMLLERNVGVLGTMAAIAPLIGLLGTVGGIMRAFGDMAQLGSAGPSVVAAGIAEALFTTAAGIVIAVPALVLYNHFARRLGTMLTVAENHARSLRIALLETGDRGDGGAGAAHGPATAAPRRAVSGSARFIEPVASR